MKQQRFFQLMQQKGFLKNLGIHVICFAFALSVSAQTNYKQLRETTGTTFVDECGRQALNIPLVNEERGINQKSVDRNSWQSLGPYGGDVTDIAICPDSTSIVFAASGSPFISYDGGTNWTQLGSLYEIANSVSTLAALPDGKIFAGGDYLYDKVAVSADYGVTWNTVNLPPNSVLQPVFVMEIEYDGSNTNIIYLATSTAFGNTNSEVLYKSTDGGQSFVLLNTEVLDPTFVLTDISIDPMNPNSIFASASGGIAGGAVIVSEDGGTTWTDRSAGLNTAYVINAVSIYNGVAYVAGGQLYGSQNFGIYKTTNGGQNWTNISAQFPVKAVNEVIISHINPAVVFAGTEGGGVYKSTDAGATWVYNSSGANNFACRHLVINPANAQEILGGFLSMAVFKSIDNGASWEASNTGIETMQLNDIAVSPVNPQQMMVAFEAQNSGGCLYSNDGGTTWILVETLPSTRYSAVAIDINGGFYAWSNGPTSVAQEGLYKSMDGGASWVNKGPTIGPNFDTEIWDIEIDENNPDRILIAGNNFGNNGWKGVLHLSTNGGDNWENVLMSQLDYDAFQYADFANSAPYNIAYAAMNSQDGEGGFYKSTDGGNNWTVINTGLQAGVKKAVWIQSENENAEVVYGLSGIPGSYFSAFKSTDGGSNWVDLNLHTAPDQSLTCLSVHPENSAVIYVGSTMPASEVFVTVTGGESWNSAANNFPFSPPTAFTKMFAYNDGYAIAASTFKASAHLLQVANPEYIAITGMVSDFSFNTPIEGASVIFDGELADYEITSNAQGIFAIEGFVAGTYTIEVIADGYNDYLEEGVEINVPTNLEIKLTAPVLGADVTAINGAVAPDSQHTSTFNVINSGSGPMVWHSAINFESEYGGVILEMNNLYSQVPSGSSFYGCEFDGQNFWVVCTGATDGLNHYLCKFDINGTLLATYDQNIAVWGLRGIYYHTNGYLYGGSNVGFHRIDPADGSTTLLFENRFGLSCIRGLTYAPVLGGFVARDYNTDFVIFDVDGNYLGSLPKPEGLSATVSGISYDPIHDCIWMYDRSGVASTTFYQYSISQGALTGMVMEVPLFAGLTTQKAGSSFFSSTLVPGKYVLGGSTTGASPQDVLFAIEICPSWMKTIPNFGFIESGESQEVVVEFNGYGLEDGETLYADLHIISSNPDVGTLDIPITLNVEVGVNTKEVDTFTGEVSPNPFQENIMLTFTLENAKDVTINILDINGRLVRHLMDTEGIAGKNTIHWNGTNDAGAILPAGIYTLVLKTGKNISNKKLIKVK